MRTLYRKVEVKDGMTEVPVQYVGTYVMNWERQIGPDCYPTVAFVEDSDEGNEVGEQLMEVGARLWTYLNGSCWTKGADLEALLRDFGEVLIRVGADI